LKSGAEARWLILLPSYNSGPKLVETMREARRYWKDVWVVIDGSTDGSADAARAEEGFRLIALGKNSGKGAAVEAAFRQALREGFTHALVMDADGQHAAASIPEVLQLSQDNPGCLIAGVPVFGPDAPPERVRGRMVGNSLALLETLGRGAKDSLFGFRVYPIAAALAVFDATKAGRRFDFDTVLAVRLAWAGVTTINVPVPVCYPPKASGGVTHFRYLRDNLLLARTHAGLFLRMWSRIPRLLKLPCR
jgi:glycosyltransferase involved in cell wall biosynthesis